MASESELTDVSQSRSQDLESQDLAILRQRCEQHSISANGNKDQLRERLHQHEVRNPPGSLTNKYQHYTDGGFWNKLKITSRNRFTGYLRMILMPLFWLVIIYYLFWVGVFVIHLDIRKVNWLREWKVYSLMVLFFILFIAQFAYPWLSRFLARYSKVRRSLRGYIHTTIFALVRYILYPFPLDGAFVDQTADCPIPPIQRKAIGRVHHLHRHRNDVWPAESSITVKEATQSDYVEGQARLQRPNTEFTSPNIAMSEKIATSQAGREGFHDPNAVLSNRSVPPKTQERHLEEQLLHEPAEVTHQSSLSPVENSPMMDEGAVESEDQLWDLFGMKASVLNGHIDLQESMEDHGEQHLWQKSSEEEVQRQRLRRTEEAREKAEQESADLKDFVKKQQTQIQDVAVAWEQEKRENRDLQSQLQRLKSELMDERSRTNAAEQKVIELEQKCHQRLKFILQTTATAEEVKKKREEEYNEENNALTTRYIEKNGQIQVKLRKEHEAEIEDYQARRKQDDERTADIQAKLKDAKAIVAALRAEPCRCSSARQHTAYSRVNLNLPIQRPRVSDVLSARSDMSSATFGEAAGITNQEEMPLN